MKFNKKIILLVAYNRPDTTENVITNLKKIYKINEYELVVVRQEGNKNVEKIINKINWITCHHYLTNPKSESSLKKKITNNMRFGLSQSFEKHGADIVVIIEDDLLLGYDFLHFCEVIHQLYFDDLKFKAINAFSKERYVEEKLYEYNKFNYGIGKGWSINYEIWKKLKLYWHEGVEELFDVYIEPWMRKGFVIMPYCSRSRDIGWISPSFTSSDEEDEYYQSMKESYVGDLPFQIGNYKLNKKMNYRWRNDCLPYNKVKILKMKINLIIVKNIKKKFGYILKIIIGEQLHNAIKKVILKR